MLTEVIRGQVRTIGVRLMCHATQRRERVRYSAEAERHPRQADEIDGPTSAAVRQFQSDQGIAHTGNPDHETVRRLGLDAEALFRKSTAVKGTPSTAGQK